MWSHVFDLAAAIEQRARRRRRRRRAAAAGRRTRAAAARARGRRCARAAAGQPALSKLVEYPGDAAEVRRLLESGECAAGGRTCLGSRRPPVRGAGQGGPPDELVPT